MQVEPALHVVTHPASAATAQIFAAPLAGGARAVVLVNFQTTQTQYPMSNVTVYWDQLGLRPDQAATVRDIYGGEGRQQAGAALGAGPGTSTLQCTCRPRPVAQRCSTRAYHLHRKPHARPSAWCRAGPGRVPRLLLGSHCHARCGSASHHADGGASQRRLASLARAAAVCGAARQSGGPAAAGGQRAAPKLSASLPWWHFLGLKSLFGAVGETYC